MSLSNSIVPTSSPSVMEVFIAERTFATQLYITEERIMSELEQELYAGIMEGITDSFGWNISTPYIRTNCTIYNQQLGSNTDGDIILQTYYNMNYSTRYLDYVEIITDYPEYFRLYMNNDTGMNNTVTTFYNVMDGLIPNWSYVSSLGSTVYIEPTVTIAPAPSVVSQQPQVLEMIGPDFSGPPTSYPRPLTTADGGMVGIQEAEGGGDNTGENGCNNNAVTSHASLSIGIIIGVVIAIVVSIIAAIFVRSYGYKVAKQPTEEEEEEESMSNRREVGSSRRPSSNIANYDNSGNNYNISNHLFVEEPDIAIATRSMVAQDCQSSSRDYGVDASTTSGIVDVGTIHSNNEEDGFVGGRNNMTDNFATSTISIVDTGFSTAVVETGTTNVMPSDGLPIESRSREYDIVDNDNNTDVAVDGDEEQLQNTLDTINEVMSTSPTGIRRENTQETMARLLLHQQSNCSSNSDGTTLMTNINGPQPTPSGLFIDPTTIDYSTIIELNDAEAGYIMTTTETASSDMPYPELVSTMTAAARVYSSNNLAVMANSDEFTSSDVGVGVVGPMNEVFASESMIQTGLLVDPATIDYAESLLVPERVSDILVVTGNGDREILFDDDGTMMNNNEILSSSTSATEPHTNQEQTGTLTSDNLLVSSPNLMAIRSDSFSSNDDTLNNSDHFLPPHSFADSSEQYADSLLDRRLGLLDELRVEITSAVDGVLDMLSLAIGRISSDIADGVVSPPPLDWIGGEDLGSIEASCLCHAFTWEKKMMSNDRQKFFEDVLNKVVLLVHHGLLEPHDCTRILHGCASIVGLTLLKELPNTTVAVQGLLKTNNLVQGHHLLVTTFEQFGEIADGKEPIVCPFNCNNLLQFSYIFFSTTKRQ